MRAFVQGYLSSIIQFLAQDFVPLNSVRYKGKSLFQPRVQTQSLTIAVWLWRPVLP